MRLLLCRIDNALNTPQVCDFGIAKFKSNTFLTTKHVQAGTPAYMAPGAQTASPCTLAHLR